MKYCGLSAHYPYGVPQLYYTTAYQLNYKHRRADMYSMTDPNPQMGTIVENNSQLLLGPDEQVVSQTIEYTEGSGQSPYFIPSSLCNE